MPVPAWMRTSALLTELVFGSALPSLRLYLLTHASAPFRRRNIRAEFHDGQDVRFLLRLLDVTSYDQALRIGTKYYPLDRVSQKTLYALEDLLPKDAVWPPSAGSRTPHFWRLERACMRESLAV